MTPARPTTTAEPLQAQSTAKVVQQHGLRVEKIRLAVYGSRENLLYYMLGMKYRQNPNRSRRRQSTILDY